MRTRKQIRVNTDRNLKRIAPRCLAAGLAILITTGTLSALAAEAPDAGKTIGGLKKPEVTEQRKDYQNVVVKPSVASSTADDTTRFSITKFQLSGQLPVAESELQALLKDSLNQEMTLAGLNAMAKELTAYMHSQGYIVATAYIPAQTIQDGIVEINIVPGKYGKVIIKDNALLGADKAESITKILKPGSIIRKNVLERALLLLNDLPGIQIKSVLNAGQQPGTSDLGIEISPGQKVIGQSYIDNYGNRFTGTNRLGFAVNLNNSFKQGDTLSLSGITAGAGLNNYGVAGQMPLGGGLSGGVSYAHTTYELGKDYASLGATGTADVTSLYLTYPLLRSYAANLNLRIGYDDKKLRDEVRQNNTSTPKHLGAWNIGLSGAWQEAKANNTYSLTYTAGHLTFGNSGDSINDAQTTQSQGNYQKTMFNFNRRQTLNDRLSLSMSFIGQYAGKNLDSSEKFSLGGANGVRAYPQGEASGDMGYLFNGELDWQLPLKNSKNNLTLAIFYDQGGITVNKNVWNGATGDNHRTLSGAGLGLILSRAREYSVRLDYAWKISSSAAVSDTDKAGRYWLQAMKYF